MDDKKILIKQSEEEYDELVNDILNTETIEDNTKRNSIKTDWLNKKMSHHIKRKLKKKKRIN